ncbi:MFS transporter [Pseudonocardia humida]|uniref:MFS transporter n=1 Tax=Pseudonocardia humida TaxID=2800819 RepID=A0ABT1A852_9PSEU|nr:MFS transporter [Pseudonocardia humida]MCO1659106.1 MFS transporter [Pseudonocardia humida]
METQERRYSTRRGWSGVAAITASLFVFLTTELMPIGLLTPLSTSLGTSTGTAALMVTLYGISAGLGAPFIVAWTRRLDRRALLTALLAVLALGNVVTAVSPDYPLVLLTRLVTGFASGVFWAIGVSMAMRIVPERHASRAAAVVMSGISVAAVVGIPLGTVVESVTDWRSTFLIWAGLSVLALLAVAAAVPSLPPQNTVTLREVFGLPRRNARLRLVLLVVVLFVLGHFGAYTFVRPFLEGGAAATPAFITVCLVVFGVGGAVGNAIAGWTVPRSPRTGYVVGGSGLAATLLLLAVGRGEVAPVVLLALWGISYGITQLSQLTMTQAAAPGTFEAAMSLNTLAYNTSIAIGAFVAGLLVDGLGVTSAVWFGVALTAASVLVALSTRRTTSDEPAPTG